MLDLSLPVVSTLLWVVCQPKNCRHNIVLSDLRDTATSYDDARPLRSSIMLPCQQKPISRARKKEFYFYFPLSLLRLLHIAHIVQKGIFFTFFWHIKIQKGLFFTHAGEGVAWGDLGEYSKGSLGRGQHWGYQREFLAQRIDKGPLKGLDFLIFTHGLKSL